MEFVTIGHLPFQEIPDAVRNFNRDRAEASVELTFKSIPLENDADDMMQCDFLFLQVETDHWEWLEALMRLKRTAPHIPAIILVPEGSIKDSYSLMRTVPAVILIDAPAYFENAMIRVVESKQKSRKRVLFVDDEELFLSIYENAFEKDPMKIFTASSAEKALATLSREAIDLVVTDIKMPGMHGLKLIEEIRKIDKSMPIIICSGYQGLKEDMYFYNVAALIEKPLKVQLLREKIMEILV